MPDLPVYVAWAGCASLGFDVCPAPFIIMTGICGFDPIGGSLMMASWRGLVGISSHPGRLYQIAGSPTWVSVKREPIQTAEEIQQRRI